jgi:hypothetical protein
MITHDHPNGIRHAGSCPLAYGATGLAGLGAMHAPAPHAHAGAQPCARPQQMQQLLADLPGADLLPAEAGSDLLMGDAEAASDLLGGCPPWP